MSRPWTVPRWWPKTRGGHAITGFNLSVWFYPELDQWHVSIMKNAYGERIFAFGPLRLRASPFPIHREHRR